MSRLNDLLRQLEGKEPAIAKALRAEYDALVDRRAFGLNFERHTPERVELPGRPVRRGDKVHILPERGKNPTAENSVIWKVQSIDRASGIATLAPHDLDDADEVETVEVELSELVVVAEFRDPIYPGLVSTGRIERGGDKPFHAVINAENYHALQTLLFTHRGQVDCIYIDPPYNTGNEGWIYNDKYVAGDDHYKHSKWLAFIERRLLLAKELLKPTGVIIVAIGDEEHHRLRMLMDDVFGADNFISNVVWQGVRKNNTRYVSNSADYMLIYARSEPALVEADIQWTEPKENVSEVQQAATKAWHDSGEDPAEATKLLRAWFRSQRGRFGTSLTNYQNIDKNGRVFYAGDLANPAVRPNLQYDLLHPATGLPCRRHPNGWRYSRETMDRFIEEEKIHFGPDHTTIPSFKRYLEEQDRETALSVFEKPRRSASQALDALLGEKRFPNPKDVDVLARWIGIVAGRGAVVLDFFGGSGTTAEAVLRMNDRDGGRRQCVLVTNNEAASADARSLRKVGNRPGDAEWEARGVYEHVTKPRISTVVTGVRPDGSTYSDGLNQNVEFLALTYEAPLRVSTNREFAKIAPMLWMRAGAIGRRIDDISTGWDVADVYGVIADLDQSEVFVKAVVAAGEKMTHVFVVTDEERLFTAIVRDLPAHVETVRLYEAYLRNFEIESGRNAL